VRHLLVTNDFPPKVGGIQSYLYELWRRLDPDDCCVLTTPHRDAAAWDARQSFRIERTAAPVLIPNPRLIARIEQLIDSHGAEIVILDPVLPLGLLGARLSVPYGLSFHGAELVVPARLAPTRELVRRVLRGASVSFTSGGYPFAEGERIAGRPLAGRSIPPGVDLERFRPVERSERATLRRRFGLPADGIVIAAVSRLVPRKGFDMAIEAVSRVAKAGHPVTLVIGGSGRDAKRLADLARSIDAPVRFLGRVPDADLPGVYQSADLSMMLCRDRWLGAEAEGFGIVFVEAAACGVPQIAGRSGGSHEAVEHGVTGLVVDDPHDVESVVAALTILVSDVALRDKMGLASRERAEREFDPRMLADDLAALLEHTVRG